MFAKPRARASEPSAITGRDLFQSSDFDACPISYLLPSTFEDATPNIQLHKRIKHARDSYGRDFSRFQRIECGYGSYGDKGGYLLSNTELVDLKNKIKKAKMAWLEHTAASLRNKKSRSAETQVRRVPSDVSLQSVCTEGFSESDSDKDPEQEVDDPVANFEKYTKGYGYPLKSTSSTFDISIFDKEKVTLELEIHPPLGPVIVGLKNPICSAVELGHIRLSDVLIHINGERTKAMKLSEISTRLNTTVRPLTIGVRRGLVPTKGRLKRRLKPSPRTFFKRRQSYFFN